jgi:undecaprenyl-diphosphatase
MDLIQSIILAIIEGITEYLPVSSTGHMIIASSFMGIASDPFVKLYTVAIQLGAILAVVVLYFKRFFKSLDFYFKLIVAFIPAAIFGLLFSNKIDELLESPLCVAISLVLGGIILLFADNWFNKSTIENSDEINYGTALKIGFFQCIAMIPGVSRSGATIIGGMSQNLSRKAAAEFSFFLAVPTMFAATGKKLLDFFLDGNKLSTEQIQQLALGNLVAFIVSILAIKFFIDLLTKYGFKLFGVYRIIVGLIILGLLLSGTKLNII